MTPREPDVARICDLLSERLRYQLFDDGIARSFTSPPTNFGMADNS